MANTINVGTRLIEEGALLPESVRFESAPRTVFYMVGAKSMFHKIAAAVAA